MARFDQSAIPMVMLAGERRFADVNRPARLLFRRSLEEMRELRVDDLTHEEKWPEMERRWSELLGQGCIAAPYVVGFPDGTELHVLFWGLADTLPGKHLIIFAPAGWPDDELAVPARGMFPEPSGELTPRELEVIRLAAQGLPGPRIAERLVLSPATIKTHFANIYAKLGVGDRAAAVARALRLGLIA
jgi:DNA-binding CsgD family transcriptional regulator